LAHFLRASPTLLIHADTCRALAGPTDLLTLEAGVPEVTNFRSLSVLRVPNLGKKGSGGNYGSTAHNAAFGAIPSQRHRAPRMRRRGRRQQLWASAESADDLGPDRYAFHDNPRQRHDLGQWHAKLHGLGW